MLILHHCGGAPNRRSSSTVRYLASKKGPAIESFGVTDLRSSNCSIVHDGTGCIKAVEWTDLQNDTRQTLEMGVSLLLRGSLLEWDDEQAFGIKSLNIELDSENEWNWKGRTLFLQKHIYSRMNCCDAPVVSPASENCDLKNFTPKQIETGLEEGLILIDPLRKMRYSLECTEAKAALLKKIRRAEGTGSTGMHFRYLHRCMASDGWKLSINAVKRILDVLLTEKRIVQISFGFYCYK